jgi:hypothetical protein
MWRQEDMTGDGERASQADICIQGFVELEVWGSACIEVCGGGAGLWPEITRMIKASTKCYLGHAPGSLLYLDIDISMRRVLICWKSKLDKKSPHV